MDNHESARFSRNNSWSISVRSRRFSYSSFAKDAASSPRDKSRARKTFPRTSLPLTVFDKIKLETDRKTSHGHPLILPAPYGQFGPAFDVFALIQNAVKKDILQAYNVLETMLRCKYEVTHTQTGMFFDWFQTFESILRTLLEVERAQIFPCLQSVGVVVPKQLCAHVRQVHHELITSELESVSTLRSLTLMVPAGESIPKISAFLDTFLSTLIKYFDLQSALLPVAISEASIDANAEVEFRMKFVDALKARPNFEMTIVFLSHWLNDTQLSSWKSMYLKKTDAWRFSFWTRKYSSSHGCVPNKLMRMVVDAQDEHTTVER